MGLAGQDPGGERAVAAVGGQRLAQRLGTADIVGDEHQVAARVEQLVAEHAAQGPRLRQRHPRRVRRRPPPQQRRQIGAHRLAQPIGPGAGRRLGVRAEQMRGHAVVQLPCRHGQRHDRRGD
jgi:hypothetical protein